MSPTRDRKKPKRSPIQQLPVELVEQILSFTQDCRYDVTQSLARSSLVSKKWHTASNSLLWNSIRLTDSNVAAFSTALESTNHKITKNLTLSTSITKWKAQGQRFLLEKLRVPGSYWKVRKRQTLLPPRLFQSLISRVVRMDRLCTLSLIEKHDTNDASPCLTTRFQWDVCRLLDHMPASVRNLEIDIEACTHCEVQAKPCLSSSIARAIPRLENLRVRLPLTCSSLLVPSSTLKTLVVNLCWRPTDVCRCEVARRGTVWFDVRRKHHHDARWKFLDAAQQALARSPAILPSLQQFVVVSAHNFDERRCGPSHLLLKDDFVAQETTGYPMWCINDDGETPAESGLWVVRISEATDPDERDVVGRTPDVEMYVESSFWTENHRKTRVVSTESVPEVDRRGKVCSQAQIRAQFGFLGHLEDCDLWEHEAGHRRCRMRPQVVALGEIPKLDMQNYGYCPDTRHEFDPADPLLDMVRFDPTNPLLDLVQFDEDIDDDVDAYVLRALETIPRREALTPETDEESASAIARPSIDHDDNTEVTEFRKQTDLSAPVEASASEPISTPALTSQWDKGD